MNTAVKWSEDMGMTEERFNRSEGHYEVGGDERGTRIYHFNDSSLARIYGRLKANADGVEQLRATEAQERALKRYFDSFVGGSLNGSVGSVDMDGAGSSNPAGRDHTAKMDFQIKCRDDFHNANLALTKNQRDVVRIVVLSDGTVEQAGYNLGKTGRTRAIQSGTKLLRDSGDALARLWGMD